MTPDDVAQALLQQALIPEIRELAGAPPLVAVIRHLMASATRKPPATAAAPGRSGSGRQEFDIRLV
jgi:hypothetical protein